MACQRWSQVKLTLVLARVDDLNPCQGQLGLRTVSLRLINANRLFSGTFTWEKPSLTPCRNYWYFECIVFLSHSAGWCRLAAGPLGRICASETGRLVQSWDSNQGVSLCQENHAQSGPDSGSFVASALCTLSKPCANLKGKSTSRFLCVQLCRHFRPLTDFGLVSVSAFYSRFISEILVLFWSFNFYVIRQKVEWISEMASSHTESMERRDMLCVTGRRDLSKNFAWIPVLYESASWI